MFFRLIILYYLLILSIYAQDIFVSKGQKDAVVVAMKKPYILGVQDKNGWRMYSGEIDLPVKGTYEMICVYGKLVFYKERNLWRCFHAPTNKILNQKGGVIFCL